MKYLCMNNLDEFRCIADKCPDTCCSGWMIEIDDASLEKYSKITGPYINTVEARINRSERVFNQKENGDCSFLCDSGLCEMYTVLGESSLCDTCRLYPRHIEEFENVRELTLSVSCPEVAQLLMKRTKPLEFEEGCFEAGINKEFPAEQSEEEHFDDFDSELYTKLVEKRTELTGILRDRRLSYNERAAVLLINAATFQDELDEIEAKACEGDKKSAVRRLISGGSESFEFFRSLFDCLRELEHLKDGRGTELDKCEAILYGKGDGFWSEERKAFEQFCEDTCKNIEIKREQITSYYIYAYFCGAVYDNYVFAKIMGSVAHTLLIEELWLAKWIDNGHRISEQEMAKIVYEYARELENSNPNLIKMDEMMDEYKFDIDSPG